MLPDRSGNRKPAPKYPFVVPDFGKLWTPEITLIPYGMGVAPCHLVPDLAELFLAAMVEKQRNARDALAIKYGSDMGACRWAITHQGMAFNFKGGFFDGQNRCLAVYECGRAIDTLVFFGVGAEKEMAVTDTGASRSVGDAAKISGVQFSTTDAAMVRQFLLRDRPGRRAGALANSEILETSARLEKDLAAVRAWFSSCDTPGADRAPVRTAFLCAKVHGIAETTLARFALVLCDKASGVGGILADAAATVFKKWILKNIKSSSGGAQISTEMFLRACAMIQSAVRGEQPSRCIAASENPFRASDLLSGDGE